MKESYLPLYRKYRPQKLEDVVGQDHIKAALSNAIKLDKISHAYLFTGPRGTGKTSTARILAKSLNCVNGPTLNPCGECESCVAVTNSTPIDVIEIDAASNRSVEDAHNILEKVQYAPIYGKYKIYIIDEVHMLTTQAFNALLKTLEEPPKNVIFILATTESHKVLDTIKSRCQRFDFKRITTNDIVEHLEKIAKLENIKISKKALTMIAKISSGGMRDSLALLDQVSALATDKELDEVDINNLLGRLSFDTLETLSKEIVNSNPSGAISILDKIYNDGNEPIVILNNLLSFFKNMLISTTCSKAQAVELTSLTDSQVDVLAQYKDVVETHQILALINKISEYIKEIKETNYQQMWLEVALIDLANLSNNTKLDDLQRRITALENQTVANPSLSSQNTGAVSVVPSNKVASAPTAAISSATSADVQNKKEEQQKTEAVDPSNASIGDLWRMILSNIGDLATQKWLEKQASPVEITKDNITLVIQKSNWVDRFNNSDKRQVVIDAAALVLGNPKITVKARTPLKDEVKVEVAPEPKPVKKVEVPQNAEPEEVSQDEMEVLNETVSQKPVPTEETDDSHSEQSKMVKELFDGKYIE